jgi:polysaccharide biosynthesis transport protein
LQDFAARSGLILAGKENTPAQDRMRQLQEALTRAEADRAAKQARYEAATANQGEVMPEALVSGPLLQYQTELQTMRRQLAELKTIYTPDNYRVIRLGAQIAETEAAIQKVREEVLDRIKNDYLAAASLERMLSISVTRQSAEVVRQTEGDLRYNVLKNELDTTQKLYDSVLERAKEAGAVSSLRMTNIRVIDPATPPPLPYSPNLPLNMAIGLGLGTVGGAGLVLLGARSGKVKQPGDLASMQVPELGVVPSASRELAIAVRNSVAPDTGRGVSDSSLLRESFRAVLTSILFSTRLDRSPNRRSVRPHSRSLVVTSLDMMEGKTTIVSHLGIASAQQKRGVLLIDADLRRPRLHQRFNLPNRAGLTNLLQAPEPFELLNNPSPEAFVQPTHIPHLWVLPSGPTEAAAADLLYSSHLDALLRYFEERFDLILIDAPPMSLYSDARILGRAADGVVMVVRANTKSREELRAAYQKLLQDQIHVVGTILNDWRIDRGQARGYARYYNHYQQQDGGPRGGSAISSPSL